MAEVELVEPQPEVSLKFLRQLEEDGFEITAAFWLLDPESDLWHLYIASPRVRTDGPRAAYEAAQSALLRTHASIPLARVKMVSPSSAVVRLLRTAVGVPGWSTVHFRQNTINGVLIKDAVLHRTVPTPARR